VKTSRNRRPDLRLDLGPLGTVNPFHLEVVEDPPASGHHAVQAPGLQACRLPVEMAGLNLVGAGQALLALSYRWMVRAGKVGDEDGPARNPGEVRLLIHRREARLLSSLLRRHLARLPQPPAWMGEFLKALEEVEMVLRWEDDP